MKFNFPKVKFAATNSAGEQLDHFLSEVKEVREELEKGSGRDIELADLEMMDALHSLETFFRIRRAGRGARYVDGLRRKVVEKNRERGYYDGQEG